MGECSTDGRSAAGWRQLREAGVMALYGDAGRGLPVTASVPAALAPMLVAAHERVHRQRAATWLDGVLTAGSAAPAPPAPVTDEDRARLHMAQRPVVLAGPGVVSSGAVPALHAFATAGRLGVLNTWGAKGIFPWQSPHHWATIGLQRDDFALSGLPEADLVVAVGLDGAEAPAGIWQRSDFLVVDPRNLAELAVDWRREGAFLPLPPLRDRLAAVTQRGWPVESAPLPPARVTRAYGELAAAGGLIAADPGLAGFWVARTVGTARADSVIVPGARTAPGFAVACALVARLAAPARPVLAVTDGPLDATSHALLALARTLDRPVPVEVWSTEAVAGEQADLDAAAHGSRLADAVHGGRTAVLPLATDPSWLAEFLDVAGPIVAWTEEPEPGASSKVCCIF